MPAYDNFVDGRRFVQNSMPAKVRTSGASSAHESLYGTFDLTRLPRLVLAGIASQQECVYVQVSSAMSLEEYL